MPSFLRPSAQRCRDFLSHPDAYVVHIPTGDDLYFTLPFDLSSLHPMRPQELKALYNFLDTIQDEVVESTGSHTLENVLQAQSIISRWLENTRCLGDLETYGWAAGLGFPVFDDFQYPVDFHWDWDAIKFEGLTSKYFKLAHPGSAHSISHSIYRHPTEYTSPPPNTPINRAPYGSADQNYMNSEPGRPVTTYGAAFENTNEISDFWDSFSDPDRAPLQDRIIQLEDDSHHGIRRIWGPNMDLYPERVERASRIDVDTIEPTKIQERDLQSTTAAKKHFLKPLQSWEDFYQRGLISYDLTAETNSLVPYADLYLLKLYKAMRDRGSSERDAMQDVRHIKSIDPSSLPERSVWNDHSRWGEEESTYIFPNEPSYCTPQVTVEQTMPHYYPEEFTEERNSLPGRRMEQVQGPGQGPERRVRFVQPPSDQEANQSTFTSHARPQYVYYIQAKPTHHQSVPVHERDSLLSSGRKRERMAGIKAAKKLSESKKKEHNRIHSDAGLQNALDDMSVALEREEAEERVLQNIAQQATHFRDHEQRTSSDQKAIRKREHNLQTIYDQASDPPSTIGVNPNAYRTVSFQEPTSLFIRPRAAARPSSYHTSLNDSEKPKAHRSSHQAYAEDSPEDSPRAERDSWRDV